MDIVTRGEFLAVGMLVDADWSQLIQQMPAAWERLYARFAEVEGLAEGIGPFVDISIARDGDQYRQLAGVVVGACEKVPDGMVCVTVPGNRYLAQRHEGPLQDIAATFGQMLDHAQRSGIEVGDLKLDLGYEKGEQLARHDLFVGIEPVMPPVVLRRG